MDFQSFSAYFISLTKNRFDLRQLAFAASDHIYNDSEHSFGFCSSNIHRTLKKFVFTLILLSISTLTISYGPFYVFFKYHQYTTVASLKIPFVDPFSGLEFAINIVIEVVLSIWGYPVIFGMEGLFALLMDATTASTECIKWHCEAFSKKLYAKRLTPNQQKMAMIKILKQIHTTDEYVSTCFKETIENQ